MTSPELLLVAGPPWSGKSSISRGFTELEELTGTARHLSIGDLKRSIIAGHTPSAYLEQLKERSSQYPHHDIVPSDAITGIFEEFMEANPTPLTVVDGFPRYPDRLLAFREAVQRQGASVLAICKIDVPKDILLERAAQARAGRSLKTEEEIAARLADHYETIAPTLEVLAEEYPSYILDGTLPISTNAGELLTIYRRHTNYDI